MTIFPERIDNNFFFQIGNVKSNVYTNNGISITNGIIKSYIYTITAISKTI